MTESFVPFAAIAVPLAESGVDTDQLCPSRFVRTPYGEGYDRILLHDRRFDENGHERRDFVLNQPAFRGAEILVAGPNFGVGSSREGAVAALEGYGFRCVIAPSFGDILFDNCARRGILAIKLPEPKVARLLDSLLEKPGTRIRVDLAAGCLDTPEGPIEFSVGELQRRCLLEGVDEIELAAEEENAISAYETRVAREWPWLGSLKQEV